MSPDPTQKGRANAPAAAEGPQHERERSLFRQLILGNPNYFGNVPNSPNKPVLPLKGDTTYEKLMCLGFYPELSQLEAIVYILQKTGYGGDLCSKGAPEYVRFYLSFDGGATWSDQGITSFQAHNIPGDKPLEYAATLRIHPDQWPCEREHLAKARAILSYNNQPPPGQPNFVPVWGNVLDANIQIAAKPLKAIPHGVIEPVVLLNTHPSTLELADGQRPQAEPEVPAHRALYPYLSHLIEHPGLTDLLMAPDSPGYLPGVSNPAQVIEELLNTSGNTFYEELDCVGLDPNSETLEATLTVKRAAGYGGGLCTHGTREYVAFWLDWNDGLGWTYTGTASVLVHDIKSIPKGGLQYAVALPLNDWGRRQPCHKGAVTPRVRAVMSWQTPPPPGNADWVPHWGNRKETRIQIKPGVALPGHTPFIETVGGMALDHISNLTGLANGAAATAGFTAKDSPFGGDVVITGHIANAGLPGTLKYKIQVSGDAGVTWQPVGNPFGATITKSVMGIPTMFSITQTVDPVDGFYTYREGTDGAGTTWSVAGNVFAHWNTLGLQGIYHIKIEAKDAANTYLGVQDIIVSLDNKAPDVDIVITTGGGNCADFLIGDVISGTYSVSDAHFGSLTLGVEPALGGTFMSPILPRVYPVVPTTGEAGTWSLNTIGMPKCGYVIKVYASDRTIVNSGYVGWSNSKPVGLCLR